ncbi:unnamed protein product [Rotaria sp. Silwood1]|nr:unnamed protein product [Rotaria sp. Silwood1]
MLCSIFFKSELTDLGVCVKNARKNYGHWWKSITVLRDINITVPTGIIYGLLGPSGCGKTTLLRCIAGRLELNRGEVIVLGKRPGSHGHEVPGRSVGYMPQETALYKNFSISEMLHHFGRLHNMSRKDILAREEFLISFLDLPSRSRNVSQLSGGQQRRVSLACALLQQPQLLILDEPTVGVDPLLRENVSFFIGRNAEHIPMALYNSEAVNGFSTGYLSLQIINKLNLDQIHLIC